MLPLLAVALLASPPEPCPATVVRCIPSSSWLELTSDDGETTWYATIAADAAVVWHGDGKSPLPLTDLRPGVRVRLTGPSASSSVATRVEVVCLGPLAMAAAVEEFVAESCGDRPWLGLTAGEVATIEALGSPSWLVRDAVSRSLLEKRGASLGLLMRARRHRDPEVRARAEAVLVRLGW